MTGESAERAQHPLEARPGARYAGCRVQIKRSGNITGSVARSGFQDCGRNWTVKWSAGMPELDPKALEAAAKVFASQNIREMASPSDVEGAAEDLRDVIQAYLAAAPKAGEPEGE